MNIRDLIKEAHETAKSKGWWDDRDPFDDMPQNIALMHSELSEALEEFRMPHTISAIYYTDNGKPMGIGVEFADVILRIADVCGAACIDLEHCLREKIAYNKTRPYRHGGKRI